MQRPARRWKKDEIPATRRSGVYVITNRVNGKVYVGSACSLRGRMQYHRAYLRRGNHHNPHLQRAWDKHGELRFSFDVLEFCEVGKCVEREQHWIDNLRAANPRSGYNICPAAGSAMLGRSHSDESRRQMSVKRKGKSPIAAMLAAAQLARGKERPPEVRAKIAATNTGKVRSRETRARIAANHWSKRPDAAEIAAKTVANRPQTLTPEHRANIAAGGRRRWAQRRNQGAAQ